MALWLVSATRHWRFINFRDYCPNTFSAKKLCCWCKLFNPKKSVTGIQPTRNFHFLQLASPQFARKMWVGHPMTSPKHTLNIPSRTYHGIRHTLNIPSRSYHGIRHTLNIPSRSYHGIRHTLNIPPRTSQVPCHKANIKRSTQDITDTMP